MLGLSTTLVIATAIGSGSHAPTLDDLTFMAGSWESRTGPMTMREVWDRPGEDAMVGHFVMRREGSTFLYEILAIEQDDGAPVMRLRHFDRGLVPWESEADGPTALTLIETAENRAVFEDPEADFPRRIVYTREGDTLTSSLEAAPDSDESGFVIQFQAADD